MSVPRNETPPEPIDSANDVVAFTTSDGAVVLYELHRPTTWLKSSASIPLADAV